MPNTFDICSLINVSFYRLQLNCTHGNVLIKRLKVKYVVNIYSGKAGWGLFEDVILVETFPRICLINAFKAISQNFMGLQAASPVMSLNYIYCKWELEEPKKEKESIFAKCWMILLESVNDYLHQIIWRLIKCDNFVQLLLFKH